MSAGLTPLKAFALLAVLSSPSITTELNWLHVTTKKNLVMYAPTRERYGFRAERIYPHEEVGLANEVFPFREGFRWNHGILPAGAKIRIVRIDARGPTWNSRAIPIGKIVKSKSMFEGVEVDLEELTNQLKGNKDFSFKENLVTESLEP